MTVQDPESFSTAIPQAAGYEFETISIGASACSVYRLSALGKQTLFLKVARGKDIADLEAEHRCLLWLSGRAKVPTVVKLLSEGDRGFLLTESLVGVSATESPKEYWSIIVARLAVELRRLHSLEPTQCPFDRGLHCVLPAARERARSGLVDTSAFDDERIGSDPLDLLNRLDQEQPESEDLVVTHGDACLSNAIFLRAQFSGFVDCGKCGRADRYQDLAIASRSIASNFGPSLVTEFFKAYGMTHIDQSKLSYYKMLDEFF